MTSKRLGITALIVLSAVVGISKPVYAHFPIEDKKTGMYASFHVTPDHDPVAGKKSVISYDFSVGTYESKDFILSLTVKKIDQEATKIPIRIDDNTVLADYTFPTQGFYTINLNAKPRSGGPSSNLEYSQRVSRGTPAETKSIGAFEIAVVIATVLIAVVSVLFIKKEDILNRKRNK